MLKKYWIKCPICNGKTRVQVFHNTVLKDFPHFCPKCKLTHIIDVEKLEIVIKNTEKQHLKIQLTISLHAATQSARNRIIPHMRIYAIEDVVKQALSYSERHNRKIVFAYLLLPGINDRPSDVRQLAKWFRGKKVMINVLQYNPTSNSRIKAPQKREIVAFKHQLEQAGLEVTMRVSHGREINAACGQLANTYNKFKKND